MDDTIAIALVVVAIGVALFRITPSAGLIGAGSVGCEHGDESRVGSSQLSVARKRPPEWRPQSMLYKPSTAFAVAPSGLAHLRASSAPWPSRRYRLRSEQTCSTLRW